MTDKELAEVMRLVHSESTRRTVSGEHRSKLAPPVEDQACPRHDCHDRGQGDGADGKYPRGSHSLLKAPVRDNVTGRASDGNVTPSNH